MEHRNPTRVLALLFAAATLAACAADPAPQRHGQMHRMHSTSQSTEPALVGAWYQVMFESNSIELDNRSKMIVGRVANVVTSDPTTRVTVIGKTDRVGSATANLALSQRRANQVRDALVNAGVPSYRIDTRWTGEAQQEVSTDDRVAEERNRVVDITVVKGQI